MLHCPTCRHENRINGDWIIHIYTDYLEYECPECGTAIQSRHEESKSPSEQKRTITAQNRD